MDNKLSELSKPVAWPNGCCETAVNALRYLAEKPRPSYGNSMFNTEHLYMIAREIERMASQHLYSQEYVSVLLAELEEKVQHNTLLQGEIDNGKKLRVNLQNSIDSLNKCIAELEHANQSQDDHINQQQDRIESLEKKNGDLGKALGAAEKRLATPGRCPRPEARTAST